jgi:hypothetical protein
MSRHDEKLQQKSSAKTEICGALDDKDLEQVTGGDKAVVLQHEKVTGAGTAPTETITFVYGGLQIKYTNQ